MPIVFDEVTAEVQPDSKQEDTKLGDNLPPKKPQMQAVKRELRRLGKRELRLCAD